MDDNTFAALLFVIVGVIYIGLGIPLLLGRIPPNAWYGCRTQKTLSSEEIWYPVNRVTGRYMIISGVAVILSAFVVFIFSQITWTKPWRSDSSGCLGAVSGRDGY